MGNLIAISGKGGTGKTTVASLIIRSLLDNNTGAILAVDADPNSNLAEMLGIKREDTISSICEEVLEKKDNIPAGMTKDRFIEYRMHQSLIEKGNLSLLTMGRPEGAGCYCYVNNLLRDMIKDLTDDYDFTVADNEAGMEHLSRKTMRSIDTMFVVSDFSVIGVRSASSIYELARSMGIKLSKSFLIINKANDGVSNLQKEIQHSGLALAGTLPFDKEVEKISLGLGSIFDIPKEAKIVERINDIVKGIICQKVH